MDKPEEPNSSNESLDNYLPCIKRDLRSECSRCYICNQRCPLASASTTCSCCHDFLYSNLGQDKQQLIALPEGSDDSYSGDDEVVSEDNSTEENFTFSLEDLPNEILIMIFRNLDHISLWNLSQVNTKWNSIVNMFVKMEDWEKFVRSMWPLVDLPNENRNWYQIYTNFIKSSWCIRCLRQMIQKEYSEYENNPSRKKLIEKDLSELRFELPTTMNLIPFDDLYYHWQGVIQGPPMTPYEKGLFHVYIQVPYSYPDNPPTVRFLTKILHPSISQHGDIGVNWLHTDWKTETSIGQVLRSVYVLLTHPSSNICAWYNHNNDTFQEQARLWTRIYAMHHLSDQPLSSL